MRRDLTVLTFAMAYPTVMALFYFLLLAGGEGGASPAQQLGYSLGKAFQFALPVLYLWWLTKRFPRPTRPRFQGLMTGVVFGVVVAGAMLAIYHVFLHDSNLLVETPELVRGKLQEFGVTTTAGYVVLSLFIAVIHSLLEEYYWRWFVFGRLREHVSFPTAALWSSLAFMAHHVVILYVYLPGYFWTAVVPFSLAIAVGGAVWAWLYEKTRSIYAAWVSHGIVDVAIFVIGYDLIRQ